MRSIPDFITVRTSAGFHIRIAPATSQAFHIRVNRTGDFQQPSPLERLGIAVPSAQPIHWSIEDREDDIRLTADGAALLIDRHTGKASLFDKTGNRLTGQEQPPYGGGEDGFGTQFTLSERERIYGLGDQFDTPLMKRGCTLSIRLRGNRVHAPIPFLMSSSGWGLLMDTDAAHQFDVGCSSPNELLISGKRGELAYYWIAGSTLAEMLAEQVRLVGPPTLLPIWAYGLSFICNQQTTARDMIEDALKFRREGIPCDMIGLEPSWMDRPFDYDAAVGWHPERFYIPEWMPEGAHTFMGALQTMGFKLSLGLPLPDDPDTDALSDGAWYERLAPFVAQGVQGFKLCTSIPVHEQQRLDEDDEGQDEAASLTAASVIARSIQEGYARQTGKRPIIYTPVGYTGVHKHAAMWSGGRTKPYLSVLALGLSGITHMGVDMHLHNAEGIHFGFFQPWSKVNSWAYWRHPLLLDAELLAIFKRYAKLRYKLLPYIYSAASEAVRTGMPITRAMPLAFPDDPVAVPLQNQYMFGSELLVAVFTGQVYLPAGRWIDYWTGNHYIGPDWVSYQPSAEAGGPLFVRAGAIIPMWPDMAYAGVRPQDRLELHLYPGGDGEFVLYEDDGATLGYLHGESAETFIRCRMSGSDLMVEIGGRQGTYQGMSDIRRWELVIHTGDKPLAVKVNGEAWREAANARKEPTPYTWLYRRRPGLVRLLLDEATAGFREPHRIELRYSLDKAERRPEEEDRQAERVPHARTALYKLEKEIEIGLETGDAAKATAALEQWWKLRLAEGRTQEKLRAYLLYMFGLLTRSAERKGKAVHEALGEEHPDSFQPTPGQEAESTLAALTRMAGLVAAQDNRQRGQANEIVRRATDIIMRGLDGELSLQAVADTLHLNSSYLSRRFKKEIGMSFSDYVLEKKMELAKELLLAGSTVGAAAERTGFKESSYFIRVFRKYWGITPGEMKS